MSKETVDISTGTWAKARTDSGYLSQKLHFYIKGERRSVCYGRFYKAGAPKPAKDVPEAQRCSGCRTRLEGKDDSIVRFKRR